MNGILLRVGCDMTKVGGFWNAPVDVASWHYAYVPIPGVEASQHHICECPTYRRFASAVSALGSHLPDHLSPTTKAHLDPDFETLSYGEPAGSSRGSALEKLRKGDFVAFYAAFRPTVCGSFSCPLAYCLFG